jgi:hypothetical protein
LAAEKKNQNTRRVTGHIAAAAATTATKDWELKLARTHENVRILFATTTNTSVEHYKHH